MKKFFLNQNNIFNIELFSVYHFLLIFITLIIVLLVILFRNKITFLSSKSKKKVRIIFSIVLIINFILRRGSFIYYNVYDYRFHLDINFCNFTSILFLIYAFTGNKKIYNICYYMAFCGPLISILIPSVNLSLTNYSFYSFLIIHHFVFIFNFIFLYMEDIKYDKKVFINTIIFFIIYFALVSFFNLLFNTQYNVPLEFINDNIVNSMLINILSYNNFTMYFSQYFVILILMFLGRFVLKKLTD